MGKARPHRTAPHRTGLGGRCVSRVELYSRNILTLGGTDSINIMVSGIIAPAAAATTVASAAATVAASAATLASAAAPAASAAAAVSVSYVYIYERKRLHLS